MTTRPGVLVTGATGTVGGQVVGTDTAVRVLTRDPDSAVSPEGVETVRGDLSVPDELDAALDGVDTVFLVRPT